MNTFPEIIFRNTFVNRYFFYRKKDPKITSETQRYL